MGPGRERKGNLRVVLSFQIGRQKACVRIKSLKRDLGICFRVLLVVDLFSPWDSYRLLVCLVLCPENLTWLSA